LLLMSTAPGRDRRYWLPNGTCAGFGAGQDVRAAAA
jgi:hypothetical protein